LRRTLAGAAMLIRSKNAGPFWLTFDVMFDDAGVYRAVRDQRVITVDRLAALYHQDPSVVRIFTVDSALAIKVSFPRPASSGSASDTDVFGGQQYAPLMDLEFELEPDAAEARR
jgi:Domain of unknown function (DUF4387)